ncbi:hypothetical protein ACWV27_26935 (plasmid) [Massilia varians]
MKFLAALLASLALISPTSAAPQNDTNSAMHWLKYYQARLPEAQAMLQACVAKGFDKVRGEELIKCEAARDAWHWQPYKPKKR